MALGCAGLVWACSSGSAKPPGLGSDGGGTSSSGGEDDSGIASDGSTNSDGSSGSSGGKDGGGDSADGSSSGGPLCGSTFQTTGAATVGLLKSPFSLSDDELVAAWADGAEPNVVVHYAERTKRTDAFVEVGTLTNADGTFALERPVLESRGYDLGMIDQKRQDWHLFSRQSRGTTFARSGKNIFVNLIDFAHNLQAGELLHDPVWSGGGRTMVFGVATKGIYVSDAILGADDFAAPVVFSQKAELQVQGGSRRRPSGMSSDKLTFLYYDEVVSQSKVAARTSAAADFTTFTSLGSITDAKVGAGCKAIYFADGGVVKVATLP